MGSDGIRPDAKDGARRMICVGCAESGIGGNGAVGARRMMRVRGSPGDSPGSGGFSRGPGSLGAVTGQPA
ncbi:hypothetical protein A5645_11175 [Mycobacterium asiaticum]|nr:hypothetical protein A5645_11175 [Mycobacterium asiaticum]